MQIPAPGCLEPTQRETRLPQDSTAVSDTISSSHCSYCYCMPLHLPRHSCWLDNILPTLFLPSCLFTLWCKSLWAQSAAKQPYKSQGQHTAGSTSSARAAHNHRLHPRFPAKWFLPNLLPETALHFPPM